MAYVITRLCRDCVDGSCVEVCPVDCIVEHRPQGESARLPNQLFINSDECIDCSMCEPACPWGAISHEDNVPREFIADVALNALTTVRPGEFHSAEIRRSRAPTSEEVEQNRFRWEQAGDGASPEGGG